MLKIWLLLEEGTTCSHLINKQFYKIQYKKSLRECLVSLRYFSLRCFNILFVKFCCFVVKTFSFLYQLEIQRVFLGSHYLDGIMWVGIHHMTILQVQTFWVRNFTITFLKYFTKTYGRLQVQKQPLADVLESRCSVFSKFERKQLCQNPILIVIQAWDLQRYKKRLQRRCFSVNLAKFLRTFFQNTSVGCFCYSHRDILKLPFEAKLFLF